MRRVARLRCPITCQREPDVRRSFRRGVRHASEVQLTDLATVQAITGLACGDAVTLIFHSLDNHPTLTDNSQRKW